MPDMNLVYLLDNLSKFKYCVITEPKSPKLAEFLKSNLLFNQMKFNTCFKSLNGSCIDLILSNQRFSLQHTSTSDTGDFHHLISTELTIL